MRRKGFTLIELLIVVAIIAILAAIAVPNFLEAQTRAKVAHVRSDLRTYTIGLAAYDLDHNRYPVFDMPAPGSNPNLHYWDSAMLGLLPLSTPVAYISSSHLGDPFESRYRSQQMPSSTDFYYYLSDMLRSDYQYCNMDWTGSGRKNTGEVCYTWGDDQFPATGNLAWQKAEQAAGRLKVIGLWSKGPNAKPVAIPINSFRQYIQKTPEKAIQLIYDPTNGTISQGIICRWVGDTRGYTFDQR